MGISTTKRKKSLKESTYPKRSKRKNRRNDQGEVIKKNTRHGEDNKLRNEIKGIVSIAIGIFLVISFQTDAAGLLGEWIANFFKGCFSSVALILPYYFIIYGVLLFIRRASRFSPLCALFLFIGILIMNSLRYSSVLESYTVSTVHIAELYSKGQLLEGAGLIGGIWTMFFIRIFGVVGTRIIAITTLIVSLALLINIPLSSILKLFKFLKRDKKDKKEEEQQHYANKNNNRMNSVQFNDENNEVSFRAKALNNEKKIKIIDYMRDEKLFSNKGDGYEESSPVDENKPSPKASVPLSNNKDIKLDENSIKINTVSDIADEYKFPPLSLLNKTRAKRDVNEREDLVAKAQKLEETLENFGVRAKVVEVSKGPTVTRYEVQPSPGVKVNSIVRLSDDIALNLQASSIRMEAPIPGKAAVGIEIQNDSNTLVTLRDVIETDEFKKYPSKIAFGIGKDISGNTVVADLAKMPHMLIAGATGSGKSVCINSIIISILYKAKPEEVKLLLIDPKVVELNVFNGIPHLLIPVVTDPSKAAAALNWAVQEMTSRYKNFAEESVRDLASYNKKLKSTGREEIPQIVIIIDELADLMMASPSQVEDAICRLAQMARAAGMHLVVATQRPSVDVITGVIKANIPSRIAFAVSAIVDSRTILDSGGAEKLLGKGDMLYYPSGMAKPMRVQGSLIMEDEVENVVEYVKKQVSKTNYSDEVIDTIETSNVAFSTYEVDELLKETIELVVASQQASVSMIQRRFRVGYNRAARLMDEMEERGIVGPNEGSKPRRVLLSQEDLDELKEN